LTSRAVAPTAQASIQSTPFPQSPRVHYARTPLYEVLCQIRFPPLLRIDSEVPAGFQESIRHAFPLFSEEDPVLLPDIPADVPPEFAALLRATSQATRRIWQFQSEDKQDTVTLTREFLGLATLKYEKWEDFRAQIATSFKALCAAYSPSFCVRIGLRYRNLILRSGLGLAGEPWSALLQPQIAAEYSSPNLVPTIRESVHRVLIALSRAQGMVNLRHGSASLQGQEAEGGYLIDNDFFTEDKTEVSRVIERLDLFNREAGRLFRWCITQKLHDAMEPHPVTE